MTGHGPTTLERLRIFVASSSDVKTERGYAKDVADELNRGAAEDNGFHLEIVRWETHARPDMGRPQQIITDQIGEFDIFVGIMWQRFGIPTGVASSGTEEEFDSALESWKEKGRPRILFYFSEAPIKPPKGVEAAEQLFAVARFREKVESSGLSWTYSSASEFKDFLREHLRNVVTREFAGRHPPIDRNFEALLDLEKDRCRERNVPFQTPNLLVALLSGNTPSRKIFDLCCPGKAELFLKRLQSFEPDNGDDGFSDFDWFDREDIKAAQRRARQDEARAIDARHILLGFLDVESNTRTELRDSLGEEVFQDLLCYAESGGEAQGTGGVTGLLG